MFTKINLAAVILAFVVIVLGAFVRLSDAGLGCPDWPGCYGQFGAPDNMEEITRAEILYPDRPVESGKAWKEMAHRYLASTLGLLIIAMATLAWRNRAQASQQLALPLVLVLLVIFQGLLGMWTVTLLLKPTIVTMHLLTGLLTLSALFWCYLNARRIQRHSTTNTLRIWVRMALLVLVLQIFLGGWTSTHYAALYCPDFPTCQGVWWPDMDFDSGFVFKQESGINYEGGILSTPAGVAVHVSHRIGALFTFLFVGGCALMLLLRQNNKHQKRAATMVLVMLFIQIALGISNVLLYLPLPVAVGHNAGAALLLLSLIYLNYCVAPRIQAGDEKHE